MEARGRGCLDGICVWSGGMGGRSLFAVWIVWIAVCFACCRGRARLLEKKADDFTGSGELRVSVGSLAPVPAPGPAPTVWGKHPSSNTGSST